MSLFSRYASSVVQKAHARVTRENAHYLAEAIRQDATIERLTQERDQANDYASSLEEALRERDVVLARANQHIAMCERADAIAEEAKAKRSADL